MGQYFQLFNIDKSVYANKAEVKPTLGQGKLGEWFYDDHTSQELLRRVAIPHVSFPKNPLEGQSFTAPSSAAKIQSLPIELFDKILESLDDYVDVYCFCVTSTATWIAGFRRLSALYPQYARQYHGSWAGDRLITIGDEATYMPEGVVSNVEQRVLEMAEDLRLPGPIEAGITKEDLLAKAKDILFAVKKRRGYHPRPYAALSALAKLLTEVETSSERMMKRLEGSDLHAPHMQDFREWTNVSTALSYPSDGGPWVLRNLTKRIYVRADTLSSQANHLGPGGAVKYDTSTLSYALTSKIVCGSCSTFKVPYNLASFEYGQWAGDHFDVVQLRMLEEMNDYKEWKDESDILKNELKILARMY